MVYLGLQDDDEYGYDQYGDYPEYGDHDDDPRAPAGATADPRAAAPAPAPARDVRDVRDVREFREPHRDSRDLRELRPPPEPYANEPTVRTIPREEPLSGVSIPRPAVMRTATPTTAARVHVVEPHGFNDAQEIGDRVKANQPVIINLQDVTTRAPAPADRLLERPRLRRGRLDVEGRRPGVPADAQQRRGLAGGEGAPAGTRALQGLTPCGVVCALVTVFIVILVARAVLSWFPVRPGTGLAQVNGILFDLTEWALRPMRRIIPPAGMFDVSFMVLLFGLFIVRQVVCCLRSSPPGPANRRDAGARVATMLRHGRDAPRAS